MSLGTNSVTREELDAKFAEFQKKVAADIAAVRGLDKCVNSAPGAESPGLMEGLYEQALACAAKIAIDSGNFTAGSLEIKWMARAIYDYGQRAIWQSDIASSKLVDGNAGLDVTDADRNMAERTWLNERIFSDEASKSEQAADAFRELAQMFAAHRVKQVTEALDEKLTAVDQANKSSLADRDNWATRCKAAETNLELMSKSRDAVTAEFKNFHEALCARFRYNHDSLDWGRDTASLIEHIAGKRGMSAKLQEECNDAVNVLTDAHMLAQHIKHEVETLNKILDRPITGPHFFYLDGKKHFVADCEGLSKLPVTEVRVKLGAARCDYYISLDTIPLGKPLSDGDSVPWGSKLVAYPQAHA